jgi:hypothetical protein
MDFGNGFSIFENGFSIFRNGFPRILEMDFQFWKWISKNFANGFPIFGNAFSIFDTEFFLFFFEFSRDYIIF